MYSKRKIDFTVTERGDRKRVKTAADTFNEAFGDNKEAKSKVQAKILEDSELTRKMIELSLVIPTIIRREREYENKIYNDY